MGSTAGRLGGLLPIVVEGDQLPLRWSNAEKTTGRQTREEKSQASNPTEGGASWSGISSDAGLQARLSKTYGIHISSQQSVSQFFCSFFFFVVARVHARFCGRPAGRACLCCGPVCPRIRLNAGILGSVHRWLPGWRRLQWEQKNMSGRAWRYK